jgi:hypothetical protein
MVAKHCGTELIESVSIKTKRFIVLSIGDRDSVGYNEETLPLLLQMIDSGSPEARFFTHTGVVSYYQTSLQALAAAENVIHQIETLRVTDSRFSTLGLGLAEGDVTADFDWLGRLKPSCRVLVGRVAAEAVACEREPEKYKEKVQALRNELGNPRR